MISVNFASNNYRLFQRIQFGLLAAIAILGIITIGMIWATVSQRMNIAALESKVKGLATSEEKMRPLLTERERLMKDLSAMSGLLESKKFSWTRFLTSIETVVPVGVALKRVEFDPKGRYLTLEGSAHSPESLRSLIVGLEKSPSFKEPLLKNQSLDKGSISFNVVAVYTETTGPSMDPANK